MPIEITGHVDHGFVSPHQWGRSFMLRDTRTGATRRLSMLTDVEDAMKFPLPPELGRLVVEMTELKRQCAYHLFVRDQDVARMFCIPYVAVGAPIPPDQELDVYRGLFSDDDDEED